MPPTSTQSHDQRSDRSRSFNTKVPSNNERKTFNPNNDTNNSTNNKKQSFSTVISANKSKSPPRASKTGPQDEDEVEESPASASTVTSAAVSTVVDDSDPKDDGFIQTKQQQRRLKRKNRMKDETVASPSTDLRSDNHSTSIPQEPAAESVTLTDRLARLQTSTEVAQSNSDRNSSAILKNVNVQPERDREDQLNKANETDSLKKNGTKG